MSRIEVKHQGFTIIYGENSDMWECYTLRMEEKTLSKLKAKINKHVRDAIKNADLVFGHRSYSYGAPERVTLVSRDNSTGNFWVVKEDGRRELAKPSNLTSWDDTIDAKMAQMADIRKEISRLDKQAREIEESIKPFSGEQIDALLEEVAKRLTVDTE